MNDLNRAYRKARILVIYLGYRQYVAGIGPYRPLLGLPTWLVGHHG